MHRKRGASLNIKEILAKLEFAANPGKPIPTQHTYSSVDIIKAKTVLDRLLLQTKRNEVSYIRDVILEVDEPTQEGENEAR